MTPPLVIDAADADASVVAECFDANGVVLVTGFVETELARSAAAELDAIVAGEPGRSIGFADQGFDKERETAVRSWGLGEVKERVPACRSILRDPRLDEWATAICGPGHTRHPGSIASTFEGCGQAWHQDSDDGHPRHFTLNRILFPAEVPAERGRLVVVPGSHRAGDIPGGGLWDPLDGEVPLAPPAGSLVLMHSRCFHMVERNRTSTPRTQFNGRVQPADCPPGVTARPLFRAGPWNFRTGRPE